MLKKMKEAFIAMVMLYVMFTALVFTFNAYAEYEVQKENWRNWNLSADLRDGVVTDFEVDVNAMMSEAFSDTGKLLGWH